MIWRWWRFIVSLRSFVRCGGVRRVCDAPPRTRSLRVHLRPERLEVIAHFGRLLRGQNPCRVLGLGIARHLRAQERTNDLAADAEFGREILGPNGLIGCHCVLPSWRSMYAHHMRTNERTQEGRERIYKRFTCTIERLNERTIVMCQWVGMTMLVRANG